MGSNQVIDESSLRIFTCEWNEDGEVIYESLGENLINNFKTEVKDNYFKIYIGNTDKNYFITYNVKTVGVQDEYTNKAFLTGNGLEKQEVEVTIEALKNFANAVGDNEEKDDDNISEDVVEDSETKKEDNTVVEKDDSENMSVNKQEDVINNNIANTGDKLDYGYILIFISSIAGIIFTKKKRGGLQNE